MCDNPVKFGVPCRCEAGLDALNPGVAGGLGIPPRNFVERKGKERKGVCGIGIRSSVVVLRCRADVTGPQIVSCTTSSGYLELW